MVSLGVMLVRLLLYKYNVTSKYRMLTCLAVAEVRQSRYGGKQYKVPGYEDSNCRSLQFSWSSIPYPYEFSYLSCVSDTLSATHINHLNSSGNILSSVLALFPVHNLINLFTNKPILKACRCQPWIFRPMCILLKWISLEVHHNPTGGQQQHYMW